ncbi:Protein UPSTREAM OF FLC [Bienertia sinuspersici]
MEVGRVSRRSSNSISGRSSETIATSFSSPPLISSVERAKYATTPPRSSCRQQQQQQQQKSGTMKMMEKVQVVYYLTRNGQLEHPHFMEVSHLSTQPLRLKDVIDRLTVLRGKAMPCQYSWSCKRSYKNGYVWNDLTENDVIYACEGSEYVLKGSEIIHHPHLSEVSRLEEVRRQQNRGHNELMTNKTSGTHNFRQQVMTTKHSKQDNAVKNYEDQAENHNNDHDDDEEEEEKGSCNSSNAPYASMQMEQEESFSLPSTSSTNSDKQPPQPRQHPAAGAESNRYGKEGSRMIQEDGDTTISTSLTRNTTTLLHLIACGGGGITGPKSSKLKGNQVNNNNNDNDRNNGSNRNLNMRMRDSFMPCLKQQLSSRGGTTGMIPSRLCNDEQRHGDAYDDDHQQVVRKEGNDEDEDMMMVRYMSENPRFGNLQSEEKEYFSGTIVEAMATTNTGSADNYRHPPQFSSGHSPVALTKSSSYNEHTRSNSNSGIQAEASRVENEDEEKKDEKVKGMIKLCMPRKMSFGSSTSTAKHTC